MLISDDDHRLNIVVQTANLRYSVKSDGLRALLREKGYDPNKCLQLSCDQGDDVNITLVLPDGSVVNGDYREHFETRQAIRFTEWNIEGFSDREIELARAIVRAPDSTKFDTDVRRYFDLKLAATDGPLPPLQWGDRFWHHWEKPPSSGET
jgi:hypothetical protein